MKKPILVLDFDGVLHSYTSGWQGAGVVADPPVEGAMQFIWNASRRFDIHIFSSRSDQPGGQEAMRQWLAEHFRAFWVTDLGTADAILDDIKWPTTKPQAMITIDDRAICFDGTWPEVETLLAFKPWNKR